MSQDFIAFARACGLDLHSVDVYDRIIRVPTFNKPLKRNGALLLRSDGNGWVIAYDGDGQLQWFNDPRGKREWTQAEKDDWERKRKAEMRARVEGWAKAAKRAAEMLKTATLAEHGYLNLKGFTNMNGLVLPDGGLLVPMRNLTSNDLQGAQVIRWDAEERRWDKKFGYGMNPRLAVMRLGPRDATTVLVEGYATGLSVEAAARQMRLTCAVLVCFSAHNLVRVAEALQNAPFKRVVFADNDDIPPKEQAKREAGEEYEARGPGELAAVKTGLPYAMAPTVGWDANDLHKKRGLLAVCSLLMGALRA